MKSVYAKVIIWCFAAILVSVVAFVFINTFVVFHTERGGMLGSVDAMILDQAVNAYTTGGPTKLSAYLDLTRRYLSDPRYLTDASGRDLVTGEDRSAMLKGAEGEWGRPHRAGASTISLQRTSDDRYRLIAVLNPAGFLEPRALLFDGSGRRGFAVLGARIEHRFSASQVIEGCRAFWSR